MTDKFTVNVKIADRLYPLEIDRKEEELVRKAAKKVDEMLAKYMEHYRGNELTVQNFLAMVAFHFSRAYLELKEIRDIEAFTEKVQKMDRELDDYLKRM